MENNNQPLSPNHLQGPVTPPNNSSASSFTDGANDIPPISGIQVFFREFMVESRKLWYLAAPAIFISLGQYSLNVVTQIFAGHVGTLELAAVSIQNSVISGFSFGVMLGMGSALETLCGQAFGASQVDMLGVYMQRSWIILTITAFFIMFFYIFAAQCLKLIGQTSEISEAAGAMALWMIPQLYAYAANFPMAKFLQAQSKMMVMAVITGVALVLHTFFSWLLMLKLRWGIVGAALVLDASWWFIVVAQLLYIFSGACGRSWSWFSWKAFQNLWGFVRLSLASAVMLCLEVWYFVALMLFAGYMKNARISVDALSICINIQFWVMTMALGCNAAISVRVSNELGAVHPRTAKFSVVVAVVSAFLIGLVPSIALLISRRVYPSLFSNNAEVQKLVYELTPLLAICIVINSVQPVLSGVAIGGGWQAFVAYVNIVCYYVFGIPMGLIMGYKLKMGVRGIWYGMLIGTVLQTSVLLCMVYRTNWNKEASIAEKRIKQWGGELIVRENDVEN
ncbi:protein DETOXIFICATION 30-like [Cornus florida]|uniref:protein DETOXIFICATION 30-like n=1 Tax=Cornus florida TaxID=4283 RepID=UPI00289E8D79|nr:protein DETOXIFICATION 30-like [Cornus florida]